MTPDAEMLRAMARLRKALEKRMRQDERAEEIAKREPRPKGGALADFDMRGFARRLRSMIDFDGRGYRAVAEEMGVTAADLSRVMAGQQLAYPKVKAICAWAGIDPDVFYLPPLNAPKPRKRPRPTGFASRRAPAAMRPAAPAGRATERDGQSALPPAADETAREMFHVTGTETVISKAGAN